MFYCRYITSQFMNIQIETQMAWKVFKGFEQREKK